MTKTALITAALLSHVNRIKPIRMIHWTNKEVPVEYEMEDGGRYLLSPMTKDEFEDLALSVERIGINANPAPTETKRIDRQIKQIKRLIEWAEENDVSLFVKLEEEAQ